MRAPYTASFPGLDGFLIEVDSQGGVLLVRRGCRERMRLTPQEVQALQTILVHSTVTSLPEGPDGPGGGRHGA